MTVQEAGASNQAHIDNDSSNNLGADDSKYQNGGGR